MFEKSEDLSAAELEFLEIFGKTSEVERKKLIPIFVRGFKAGYNVTRRSDESRVVINNIESAETLTGNVVRMKGKWNPIQQAKVLGEALGIFLGAVEYGIPKIELSNEGQSYILEIVSQLSLSLRVLNKNIKLKFIQNRIKVIARKHGGQLSRDKQILYAKIAATFSPA